MNDHRGSDGSGPGDVDTHYNESNGISSQAAMLIPPPDETTNNKNAASSLAPPGLRRASILQERLESLKPSQSIDVSASSTLPVARRRWFDAFDNVCRKLNEVISRENVSVNLI